MWLVVSYGLMYLCRSNAFMIVITSRANMHRQPSNEFISLATNAIVATVPNVTRLLNKDVKPGSPDFETRDALFKVGSRLSK